MSDRPSAEKIVEHLRKIQNDERVDFHARGYAEFGADEIERLRAALLKAYQFISPISDPMPITAGEMARELMTALNIHKHSEV